MKKLNTGKFTFDGVEVLDFAGPFEVFSTTRLGPVESRRSDVSAPFKRVHGGAIGGYGACDRWAA